MRKDEALKNCARWLAFCRQIGWPQEDLDRLEGLWWKYHDENGNLIDGGGIEIAIGATALKSGHQ